MSLINLQQYTEAVADITGTSGTAAINVAGSETFGVMCVIDVNTPANKAFTSAEVVTGTDTITTATAHGLKGGLKVQLTTSGALPAGVTTSTDYFIIVVDATSLKFASSLANALAGTAIDLTDVGSGNSSINPVALAGGTVGLQKSNDGTNWVAEGSTTAVTADANVFLEKIDPCAQYIRVQGVVTAGMFSVSCQILVKGLN